ncbi:MAG: hypothetical protein C4589_09975 [Peptococcaceae bacterium]|nr:MAG: hypothetical protein C4589_09975 [Peptococcaceae bacterium]
MRKIFNSILQLVGITVLILLFTYLLGLILKMFFKMKKKGGTLSLAEEELAVAVVAAVHMARRRRKGLVRVKSVTRL